jgi:hypothetical protein
VEISDGAKIKCVKVVNESNIQSKLVYKHSLTSNIIGYWRRKSSIIFEDFNLTYVNEEKQQRALVLIRYVSSINHGVISSLACTE